MQHQIPGNQKNNAMRWIGHSCLKSNGLKTKIRSALTLFGPGYIESATENPRFLSDIFLALVRKNLHG